METQEKHSSTTPIAPKKTFTWRQAAGIAIIIILFLAGVWTVVQIGPYLPNTVENITAAIVNFTDTLKPSERLLVYSDQERIKSGDKIMLTWSHRGGKTEGSYALSFPCLDGISVKMKLASGTEETLLCDIPYTLSETAELVTLAPFSKASSTVAVPFSISFTPLQGEKPSVSGSATVSIENGGEDTGEAAPPDNSGERVSTPNTQPTAGVSTEHVYYVGTTTEVRAYGKTDLAPKILDVGVLDTITNQFTATTTLHATDRIAVRFQVENVGTANSGTWNFNAMLPTAPAHTFVSENQQTLSPGEHIEYTLGFDSFDQNGDGRFALTVDPANAVNEVSETNNVVTTTIHISPN